MRLAGGARTCSHRLMSSLRGAVLTSMAPADTCQRAPTTTPAHGRDIAAGAVHLRQEVPLHDQISVVLDRCLHSSGRRARVPAGACGSAQLRVGPTMGGEHLRQQIALLLQSKDARHREVHGVSWRCYVLAPYGSGVYLMPTHNAPMFSVLPLAFPSPLPLLVRVALPFEFPLAVPFSFFCWCKHHCSCFGVSP